MPLSLSLSLCLSFYLSLNSKRNFKKSILSIFLYPLSLADFINLTNARLINVETYDSLRILTPLFLHSPFHSSNNKFLNERQCRPVTDDLVNAFQGQLSTLNDLARQALNDLTICIRRVTTLTILVLLSFVHLSLSLSLFPSILFDSATRTIHA